MELSGNLARMCAQPGSPVAYSLALGGGEVDMNALLGRTVRVAFTGALHCRVCSRPVRKLYGEGYCYPHFVSDPANAPCIVRPELCTAHLGGGRDPAWESANHDQPHVVYLAVSGALKVGVTRRDNIPARWIDQGASRAVAIAQTPYRRLAGDIEVALKSQLSDRTAWQRMLTGADDIDLHAQELRVAGLVPQPLQRWWTAGNGITVLDYPVLEYPRHVRGVRLDRTPVVEARLTGIRGQYLLFAGGLALNLRRHTGYHVSICA
ncbi:MAG: DUF2797 domain-containing protein [Gammaproteobacteria bacterium]|nr:DUF2797 domain-containing protein [Gammaproteobacteria bacterium]